MQITGPARTNRVAAAAMLASASAFVLTVASTVDAATTYLVTTAADTTANDGLLSLREAFDLANGDADDSIIELADAVYQLTDCEVKEPIDFGNGFFGAPSDDDLNADGDLDHTDTFDLTIEGNGATIENTCLYDRVIHSQSTDARLILDDVTITGGVGAPGEGSNVWAVGGATLTDVSILDGLKDVGSQTAGLVVGDSSNMAFVDLLDMTDSFVLGNQPAGVAVNNGNGTITRSVINDNDGPGARVSFGTLQITDSSVVDNNGTGVAGIDGAITITDSALANNNGYGARNTGNSASGQPLEIIDTNVFDNAFGGVRCSFCTALVIERSTVAGNFGTAASMVANLDGPTMTIIESDLSDNGGAPNDGTGVAAEAGGVEFVAEDGVTPIVFIDRSTIADNTAAPGVDGGGISVVGAGLHAVNSTITGNVSSGGGGGIASTGAGAITLEFVTLVRNESALGGANLDRLAPLTVTGTAIGEPVGSVNCVSGGPTTSNGGNIADDNTCAFGGGPGDLAPVPSLLLGTLADTGGPTRTIEPLAGSPLLGAVAPADCSVAADQRGVSRPAGPACEAGAVEVDERLAAVIVVGRSSNPLGPDRRLRNWLRDAGYAVALLDDDLVEAAATSLDDADLVVVTSSVVPSKVGDTLVDVDAPILVTEGYLLDDFGMAQRSGETATPTTFIEVLAGPPGIDGFTSVYRSPHRLAFGTPSAAADVIARAPVNGRPPVIFTYDTGDTLADGSVAPAPRAGFFFDYSGPTDIRQPARQLFVSVANSIAG